MDLGQKLKDARVKAGLSQEALAQQIGVSRQTISNWENSRSYPDIGSLIKLSQLYSLSLDEMLQEDTAVQSHFENQIARRKNICQITIEVGIVLQIMGSMLLRQKFPGFGAAVTFLGVILMYLAMISHLRLFDHTRKEIQCGILGLILQLGGLLFTLILPELADNLFFTLIRLGAVALIWYSGVWTTTLKSPRLWLLAVLYVAFPLFTFANHLQDTGSLNTSNPFGFTYRVEQVLYPENTEPPESTLVDLELIFSDHQLQIAENGQDYEDIGTFTYLEPVPEQTATGIWQLIPEENPDSMYKVTAEADGSVTLSYSENEQLQYKWLLSRVDTTSIVVATFGSTMSTNPRWYPAGIPDPEPGFSRSDVLGSAKMSILIENPESSELTLIEEYHHGEQVEYQTYTLQPNRNGSYTLELKTRYDGQREYALYRIAFAGGEYRFILTFG